MMMMKMNRRSRGKAVARLARGLAAWTILTAVELSLAILFSTDPAPLRPFPIGVAGLAEARAADAIWVDPDSITIPPLNQIQVPEPERFVMKNGLVVYLLEDHDFPLVDARVLLRAGAIYEPREKVGLSAITGEVMRTGGSTNTPGDELDRRLASLGASVELFFGSTDGTAYVSTLSSDLEEGLSILADILRRPAFPEEKLELAKKSERTAIASRNDEPMSILFREFPKLIFGADHPYARHTEYATIDAISREDLVAFHKSFVHPDRMIMTLYGDFDRGKVKKLLNRIFGDWSRSSTPLPPDPEVAEVAARGLYMAPKADMTNSMVVMGHLGMRMDHPDHAEVMVLNEILGGGWASRIWNEIRTRRGLAYATGSFAGTGMHHPEAFFVYAMTQSDSTAAAAGYMEREIERILADGVTEAELEHARDTILNQLVFTLSSRGAVLYRLATYEFYGYPRDFLQRYQEEIRRVTPEDVLQAARRYIEPSRFVKLFVGQEDVVRSQIDSRGLVQEIDISIPEPAGAAIGEGTPADYERGRDLLKAAAAATGGPAWAAIKDITMEEDGSLSAQGMQMPFSLKSTRRLPDCERSDQAMPMGTATSVICGDKGWQKGMQGLADMKPEDLQEAARARARDLLTVMTEGDTWRVQSLSEPAEVDGRPADVVLVRGAPVEGWKIFFDRESHRIVRMEYRDRSPLTGTTGVWQETLGDYQPEGDILWPRSRSVLIEGEPFLSLKVKNLAINTGVSDAEFQKPAP